MVRHIVPVSGKDSACTALLLQQAYPERQFEYFHNATAMDMPEVQDWLGRIEGQLGITITRIGADLKQIIYDQGILPAPWARYCTRKSKIQPMEEYLGDDEAVIYYGIRADEDRAGYNNAAKPNLQPVYPLVGWGICFEHVWQILAEKRLLPPGFHWQWMEDAVRSELGSYQHWLDNIEPWSRRELLAWRTRTNCYNCFYQRRYEWVGLSEHHPELFRECQRIEQEVGGEGFDWDKEKSLDEILGDAPNIKARRVKKVVRALEAHWQGDLFSPENTGIPVMGACGLFCSK